MISANTTHRFQLLHVLLVCLWLVSSSHAAIGNTVIAAAPTETANISFIHWRGGAFRKDEKMPSSDNANNINSTVEEYVAAMKEKDNQDGSQKDDEQDSNPSHEGKSVATDGESSNEIKGGDDDNNANVVGVKEHAHNSQKKSNAVGDPDGGDDDDDDDGDDTTDYSEEWEEMEDFDETYPQVQVQVNLLEEGLSGNDAADADADADDATPTGGGGVGVRLGRMNKRRKQKRMQVVNTQLSHDQTRLIDAWIPHIYFPPTKGALEYLAENARMLDASSKTRLDRRTLYGNLLLEWGCGSSTTKTSASSTSTSSRSNVSRKFLPSPASQALQAALSMATQPQWRESSPRTSGIALYQGQENGKECTLGMQETTAMALVSTRTGTATVVFLKCLSSWRTLFVFLYISNQSSLKCFLVFFYAGSLFGMWYAHFGRPCH
jgi:hypothetical protein